MTQLWPVYATLTHSQPQPHPQQHPLHPQPTRRLVEGRGSWAILIDNQTRSLIAQHLHTTTAATTAARRVIY